MTYTQTRDFLLVLDSLETYIKSCEREKNKGEETVWSEVAYYSTLIKEAKETIFDMVNNK